MNHPSLNAGKLAECLALEFSGDPMKSVQGVASLKTAQVDQLCFIRSEKFVEQLQQSLCGIALVPKSLKHLKSDKTLLFSDNPHASFVDAISVLDLDPKVADSGKVHISAVIDASASLHQSVTVGAAVVIGEGVVIGPGTRIDAGSVVENNVSIGANCWLASNCVVSRNCVLGNEVIIQSGAIIGSEGFGLVEKDTQWRRIPHLGKVILENRVEVGANTTIDRGALDDTMIHESVKIDNLVQIAHNVEIGKNTAIAACVAIAGSVKIGENCQIAGAVGIAGHLLITDNVTITAMTLVTKSIQKSGVWSSGTPLMSNLDWHKANAHYKNPQRMIRKLMGSEP